MIPAPLSIDEDDEDYENNDENETEALDLPEGYVLYRDDDDGSEEIFRKPLPILKTRLRFKLLTLLRAGCDPNLLDSQSCSPSDDARYYGLWPEWTWALLNAGYVFDEDSDRWVEKVEDEVLSGSQAQLELKQVRTLNRLNRKSSLIINTEWTLPGDKLLSWID